MSVQGVRLGKSLNLLRLSYGFVNTRNFSRRTNNVEGPFKVVKSRSRAVKDETALVWRDPNFEMLASTNGFPFFMPGNVGPAWVDIQTTVQTRHEFIMEQIENKESDGNIICRVQICPTVLRQTVCDLFPYCNLENAELTVITISLKPDLKLLRKNAETETEKMAQTFVLTAKNVCDKLRGAGYWADFINPFSGRPYLFPTFSNTLYETDEKFRCLDFQIFEIEDCKVISNDMDKTKKRFIGSLFTNAPSKKNHLNNIFTKC